MNTSTNVYSGVLKNSTGIYNIRLNQSAENTTSWLVWHWHML